MLGVRLLPLLEFVFPLEGFVGIVHCPVGIEITRISRFVVSHSLGKFSDVDGVGVVGVIVVGHDCVIVHILVTIRVSGVVERIEIFYRRCFDCESAPFENLAYDALIFDCVDRRGDCADDEARFACGIVGKGEFAFLVIFNHLVCKRDEAIGVDLLVTLQHFDDCALVGGKIVDIILLFGVEIVEFVGDLVNDIECERVCGQIHFGNARYDLHKRHRRFDRIGHKRGNRFVIGDEV